MPMIVGLALVGGRHELLDALIDADVVDFEARPFGHHADEVLADVVQVAANRAHQQHAGALDAAVLRAQQRLQHRHARLHRPRGDQHFGNVEHVVLEVFADDAHAGDQAVGQHLLHRTPLGQGVLRHLLDLFGLALVEVLVHQRVIRHRICSRPGCELNSSSASSIATMFSRGMPGLTPPPTERITPSPPEPFEHIERRFAALLPACRARAISSGFTLPIRHIRSPTRAFTSRMSFCLPQFSTLNPASGRWSRHASTSASL